MQLNVLTELRQRVGSVTVVDFEEPPLKADDLELTGLKGSVSLLRTDKGLLVSVEASGAAREKCSRCLVEITCPIEVDFEEEYVPVIDAGTGAPLRIDEAGDLFHIGPDFTLDLREGLRQYILMSEPAKPLCKADCAGLCPSCGADLNRGPCGCAPRTDERWQALAGLKTGDKEGS